MFDFAGKRPTYYPEYNIQQNVNQSIISEKHRYDMTRFSPHETSVIVAILNAVKEKYPCRYRSMGFANESYPIVYKPRYVLHEIVVQLYGQSRRPVDRFAVALAYATKSARFRPTAIQYFEAAIPFIRPSFMSQFWMYQPLHVYTTFSKLYEGEHEYAKAIHYTELAWRYGEADNPYFPRRVDELHAKLENPPKHRPRKPTEDQMEFEREIVQAAQHFIQKYW